MTNKFLIYCKSDGIKSALRYLAKFLFSLIYKNSITVFYRRDAIDSVPLKTMSLIKELSPEQLEKIDFPRLKIVDYQNWVQLGSRVFVYYINHYPVAFTWTHYGDYLIHGTGRFHLANDECWLGPTFVDHHFRGQGINKQQILYQMTHSDALVFYTSVNINNVPSQRSFLHLGFKEIGRTIEKGWFGRTSFIVEGEDSFKKKISR